MNECNPWKYVIMEHHCPLNRITFNNIFREKYSEKADLQGDKRHNMPLRLPVMGLMIS